ncbi:MAG: acetoacetyl-CoA reductase [Gammaproteobacteria bacterium]|nr:acetoacetyl-CoA reductase [Gammaproteobacteria bacterium]MCB1922498.1 acetoacetyl-CoA reductase [Gammaproteobacteria bacterium]
MTKRVAFVTGGNGGIGSAICRELAKQGHSVVAGYFPPEKESAEAWQKQMHDEGFAIGLAAVDVSSFEDCERAVAEIGDEFGSVDILVNCAGITRDGTLKKMPEANWKAVISTNLDSAFNVTRHVVNGMLDKGWGRIINIASVNGQRGQFGQANYSAAKAGMHGFTMAVALETAAKGITVNTVSPGYIATAMTEAMPEEVLQSIVNSVPMRRMGKPEEIANTVAWLASEENAYTTGANIPVNGGLFTSH